MKIQTKGCYARLRMMLDLALSSDEGYIASRATPAARISPKIPGANCSLMRGPDILATTGYRGKASPARPPRGLHRRRSAPDGGLPGAGGLPGGGRRRLPGRLAVKPRLVWQGLYTRHHRLSRDSLDSPLPRQDIIDHTRENARWIL